MTTTPETTSKGELKAKHETIDLVRKTDCAARLR